MLRIVATCGRKHGRIQNAGAVVVLVGIIAGSAVVVSSWVPPVLPLGTERTRSRSWYLTHMNWQDSEDFSDDLHDTDSKSTMLQTYGADTAARSLSLPFSSETPMDGTQDETDAMNGFFDARKDWVPLFQRMLQEHARDRKKTAKQCTFPAQDYLRDNSSNHIYADSNESEHHNNPDSDDAVSPSLFVFDETSWPWRRFPAVPRNLHDEDNIHHRAALHNFLNAMQDSLIQLPVTDSTAQQKQTPENEYYYDAADVHFLEEGRRMLAIQRFHVLNRDGAGTAGKTWWTPSLSSPLLDSDDDKHDALFSMCWSEMLELISSQRQQRRQEQQQAAAANEINDNEQMKQPPPPISAATGTIIILPDYALHEVQYFAIHNVLRPLQWLGLDADFEVASIQQPGQGSPALRILYQLPILET